MLQTSIFIIDFQTLPAFLVVRMWLCIKSLFHGFCENTDWRKTMSLSPWLNNNSSPPHSRDVSLHNKRPLQMKRFRHFGHAKVVRLLSTPATETSQNRPEKYHFEYSRTSINQSEKSYIISSEFLGFQSLTCLGQKKN